MFTSNKFRYELTLKLNPRYYYFQVWKKTFVENLRGFDLDPFDDSRILLRCVDCILFLGDFSTTKSPSGNGKKFYVSGKI